MHGGYRQDRLFLFLNLIGKDNAYHLRSRVISFSFFLTRHETDRLNANRTKAARETQLILHSTRRIIRRATIGTRYRAGIRVDWIKCLAINRKRLGFVIHQLVFVTGHLFTLLQNLCGLGTQISIALTTHVWQFQQSTGKTCRHNKVLVLKCCTHGRS